VNQRLSELEQEIESLKGRLQYLRDRAAYSTITAHVRPERPTPTVTATPSPTPTYTPTVTPTPEAWNPGGTYRQARGLLVGILKLAGDMAIWIGVVLVPLAIPVVLVAWGLVWVRRRWRPTEAEPLQEQKEETGEMES
jgi:hypothetical protein